MMARVSLFLSRMMAASPVIVTIVAPVAGTFILGL
jgi:hypothetical protein